MDSTIFTFFGILFMHSFHTCKIYHYPKNKKIKKLKIKNKNSLNTQKDPSSKFKNKNLQFNKLRGVGGRQSGKWHYKGRIFVQNSGFLSIIAHAPILFTMPFMEKPFS